MVVIMEIFDRFNKKRRQCLPLVILTIAFAFIGFFGSFFGIIFRKGTIVILSFVCLLLAIVFGVFTSVLYSKLKKQFKDAYIKNLVKEVLPDASYYPQAGIPIDSIYRSHLVKKADRSHVEDLIKGEIDGVSYSTCDVKLEERHVHHTSNGTSTTYVTFFQGRFFEFEFPKSFKGQLLVSETSLHFVPKQFKKIELENVEFNEKFKTYCLDEHSAFYVLTPHLMEALMKLEKTYSGAVSFSFTDSKLCIAIDNRRDSFEIKLTKKLDEEMVHAFRRDLLVIPNMIQLLKLDKNIFYEEV